MSGSASPSPPPPSASPSPSPPSASPSPPPSASASNHAGTSNDPHVVFDGGSKADFRGINNAFFAMISAKDFQANVRTVDRTFQKLGGQKVYGSFIDRLYLVAKSWGLAVTLFVAVLAEQSGSFRLYSTNDINGQYANRTALNSGDDLSIMATLNGFEASANGFVASAKWRHLRMPLDVTGKSLPMGHSSHFYLDTSYHALADTTVDAIAPHGLVGQSFDGSKIAVHGKRDNYGHGRTFTTSAQAEGAIEGTYKDYMVKSPLATSFKYSRYGAQGPIAPRNVSALTGRKEPKVVAEAGTTELVE